jgi:hypothetical protein
LSQRSPFDWVHLFGQPAEKREGRSLKSIIIAFVAGLTASLETMGASVAQTDPNPALNNPDEQSWKLFVTVNANAAGPGDNNALFETWASDGDMFQTTPVWPSGGSQMQIGARALSLAIERPHPHFLPEVLPTGERLIGEETRRNKSAFDFIVQNNLFKVSGVEGSLYRGQADRLPGRFNGGEGELGRGRPA